MDVERRRRKEDRSGGVCQCMDSVNVDCRAHRRKPYCVEATCHLHRPHLEVGEYAVVRVGQRVDRCRLSPTLA